MVETDRETLIREGDEEAIRRQQEQRRKKKDSPSPLTAIEEAIEEWARKHGNEEEAETKQAQAQIQVTEDPHDKEPFHLKSKIGIAKTGSNSLRATIPEGIVVFLDLKAGDKLQWKMEVIGNERVAVVKKKDV
jgi:hypothetical protein